MLIRESGSLRRVCAESPQIQLNTKRSSRTDLNEMRLLSFFAFLNVGVSLETTNPIVTLPYGSFRGQVVGKTAQFLGIPFTAPPYVVDSLLSAVQFHRSLHTALVNAALVFRNLPYLLLAHMMQLNLDHRVISKH